MLPVTDCSALPKAVERWPWEKVTKYSWLSSIGSVPTVARNCQQTVLPVRSSLKLTHFNDNRQTVSDSLGTDPLWTRITRYPSLRLFLALAFFLSTAIIISAAPINKCRFPYWLSNFNHWHTLDYSATYTFHHRNSTLRITNSTGNEMKVVCIQIKHTSRDESIVILVAHFTMGW